MSVVITNSQTTNVKKAVESCFAMTWPANIETRSYSAGRRELPRSTESLSDLIVTPGSIPRLVGLAGLFIRPFVALALSGEYKKEGKHYKIKDGT